MADRDRYLDRDPDHDHDRDRRRDPLSAGAGLVFLVVALTVLLGGGDALVDNGGWLLPAALIALGVLGIASAGPRRGRR